MEEIVVEITHQMSFVEYKVFNRFPIRIGRAFDNDLILADPFISPHHLEVGINNGLLYANEVGNENGVFYNKHHYWGRFIPIQIGEEVVIGNTKMRFFAKDSEVKKTRLLYKMPGFIKFLSKDHVAVPFILIVILFISLTDYLLSGGAKDFPAIKIVMDIIARFVFASMWCGFWALIGKVAKHSPKFLFQMVTFFLIYVLYFLCSYGLNYIGYIFNMAFSLAMLQFLLFGIIFGILFYANLSIATTLSRKFKLIITSILLIIILFISVVYYSYSKKDGSIYEPNASIYPSFVMIGKVKDIPQFIEEVNHTDFRLAVKKNE